MKKGKVYDYVGRFPLALYDKHGLGVLGHLISDHGPVLVLRCKKNGATTGLKVLTRQGKILFGRVLTKNLDPFNEVML